MPSLTLSDRLIWFAHCPKAGGTSVEHLMVEVWGDRVGHLHWGWDRWWRAGGWRQADPPNSPQHLTWADARPGLADPPDAVFALVRDPVERLASEHRFQRHLRRGTRAGRILAYLPFSLWLRVMLMVAHRNPFAFDNHLRPQSDFIPEGAEVFKLEQGMEALITWLETATATKLSRPERQLTTAPRVWVKNEIKSADQALMAEAYSGDYARFGYTVSVDATSKRPILDYLANALAPLICWLDRRGRL